jgi:predicted membrane-bound spermidine synthase
MNKYLYFVVFTAGMTTLALELTASRLLGSFFGTSNLVWASIIGLILIYLTVGYLLGGWWSDRSPDPKTMYRILAWGAFTAGLIPLIARPVLRRAADAFDLLNIGVLFGSFTAVLVLFSLPVILLGTISPFAVRLAITDREHAGRVSGRVYAISTIGSFIGTFLPVLILIPLVGTTKTFLIFSFFLLAAALVGLGLCAGWRAVLKLIWMPAVLVLAAYFMLSTPIKNTSGQIFEIESGYNYIQVLDIDGYRMLRLNEGQGIHSMWHEEQLDYFGPWEQFLAAPFFNPAVYEPKHVERIAILGLAAGTSVRQINEIYGPIVIDGYEIDPKIIEVGRKFFAMNQTNLNPIAQDGRIGLQTSKERYDVIVVDAYRPPYIPWHLTTREFFRVVYDHLEDDGVMAINVGRSPEDRRLVDALAGTISAVFPSIYVMDVPDTFNTIIYATVQPTVIQNLYDNLVHLYSRPDIHPLLIESIQRVVINQQPTPSSEIVFTDDWAPVEWITNNLILDYVLFGEIDELDGYR